MRNIFLIRHLKGLVYQDFILLWESILLLSILGFLTTLPNPSSLHHLHQNFALSPSLPPGHLFIDPLNLPQLLPPRPIILSLALLAQLLERGHFFCVALAVCADFEDFGCFVTPSYLPLIDINIRIPGGAILHPMLLPIRMIQPHHDAFSLFQSRAVCALRLRQIVEVVDEGALA